MRKTFHGVTALSNVNLTVQEGQIHAVVGENGAGKSTLMKVLSGVYPHGDYEGTIRYQGEECRFRGIQDSEEKGIIIIHQELALVPLLALIPSPWRLLAGVVPSYWLGELMLGAGSAPSEAMTIVIGAAVHAAWLWAALWLLSRKVG